VALRSRWIAVLVPSNSHPTVGEIRVVLTSDERRALITVTDNGAGIDPTLIPFLFAPAETGRGHE
jgi:C4-dicarboxylate-specific signal transduction histidine kinase